MNIIIKHTKKTTAALALVILLAFPFSALAAPGNVKGVQANAESSTAIKLNWNAVEGAVKYRVYYNDDEDGGSVQNGETFAYVNETDTPSAETSFNLGSLKADTMYYMSLTALDAQGEESDSYSLEVQAKTTTGQAGSSETESDTQNTDEAAPQTESETTSPDTLAPMVLKVMAEDSTHILVGFSEKVVLPTSNPTSAFTIQEQINTSNTLEILSVKVYSQDPTGKTIVLETAPQIKNTNYIVTAGIQIKDEAGNSINSGSSDSGLFVGTDTVQDEETTPTSTTGTVVECGTHYASDPSKNTSGAKECFDVSFQTCITATYTKVSSVNGKESHHVYEVVGKGDDTCKVKSHYTKNEVHATWENQAMTCEYDNHKDFTSAEMDVLNSLSGDAPLGNCSGPLATLLSPASTVAPETTATNTDTSTTDTSSQAPEEVTNLRLTFQKMADSALYMVGMNWTASKNSAGNLLDQIVYQSMDLGKNYDAGQSVGKDATAYNVENLEGGKEYTFKVATKDAEGNESVGAVKSIRLPDYLPESGVGAGLLLLGSSFAAHRVLRRKKR